MAQETRDSSDHLNKRVSDLENVLSQLAKKEGINSSGTRKRTRSADGDGGSKRSRSDDGKLQCTMCDKTYCAEWSLIRHYKDYHKEKNPGRLYKEILPKIAKEISSVNKEEENTNCELCEAAFSSILARNSHYISKHQIKDEKLLFFPNGSPLVESPLENEVKNNQEYFKTVCKRNMPSRACKLCEIELDPADLICHYERDHKVIQTSRVKGLIRLNDTDIEKLRSSEKCNYCSDAFADTDALEKHVYTQHANIECKICKKRIEKETYNDHVKNEHPDVFFKKPSTEKVNDKIDEETEKRQASKTVNASPVDWNPLLYMCDECNLVTSSYDNAVAHSQDHILKNVTIEPKLCEACNLKFDVDYSIHEQMHLNNDDLDRDSFRFVSYDYKNLTNDKWLDMFDAFTKVKIKKITSASIYFSTRCIRLKLLLDCRDASAPFTLFKCLKCENYVHPKCVESHVGQQSACTSQGLSYECVKCKKVFQTSEAMEEHKKTHDEPDSDSKYRTVLFNDSKDFHFNKALLENAGKSVLVEKEVINKNVAERQTPVQKIPITISETNNANIKGVVTPSHEGAGEHKMSTNAEDKRVADVYKCACGLCFEKREFLLMHMRNCSNNSTNIPRITCTTCKLDFDRENFSYHCKAHKNGITTFNVKRYFLVDEMKIDANGAK